jgi:predicted 2-oxoglutarate/Fe(II)-dependent dioxygenase YbiX
MSLTTRRTTAADRVDIALLARAYWIQGRAERALAVLDAGIRARPGDATLVALADDIRRSRGNRAAWERRGGAAQPVTDRPFLPAPYVAVDGFLAPPALEDLRALVADHRDAFGSALVGEGTVDLDRRRTLRLRDAAAEADARDRFLPVFEAALPSYLARLAPGGGPMTAIECKVTACTGGGFFKVHRDDRYHAGPGRSNHDRVVSYVCWFHREPARFTGGDLVLHDTAGDRYSNWYCTRFAPRAGTLVVFPSRWFHAVEPVRGDADDVIDGRLALTGHVRAAGPLSPGAPS